MFVDPDRHQRHRQLFGARFKVVRPLRLCVNVPAASVLEIITTRSSAATGEVCSHQQKADDKSPVCLCVCVIREKVEQRCSRTSSMYVREVL